MTSVFDPGSNARAAGTNDRQCGRHCRFGGMKDRECGRHSRSLPRPRVLTPPEQGCPHGRQRGPGPGILPAVRAAWMHAAAILRGAWRTTLVLAVLAGVAGGLVLAGWSAVRRGATSIERFEQSVGEADLTVATCGPDGRFDLDAGGCAVPYLPFAERDRIAAIPGVEAAGVGAIFPLWYSGPKLPDEAGGGVWAMADGTFPTAMGTPVVVDGRMFDPESPDEMLVTEDVVAVSGIGVGDTLTVRGYPLDQGVDLQAPPQGEPIPVRVVGVVRFPTDLSPLPDRRGRRAARDQPVPDPRLVRTLRTATRRLLDCGVRPLRARHRPDGRHRRGARRPGGPPHAHRCRVRRRHRVRRDPLRDGGRHRRHAGRRARRSRRRRAGDRPSGGPGARRPARARGDRSDAPSARRGFGDAVDPRRPRRHRRRRGHRHRHVGVDTHRTGPPRRSRHWAAHRCRPAGRRPAHRRGDRRGRLRRADAAPARDRPPEDIVHRHRRGNGGLLPADDHWSRARLSGWRPAGRHGAGHRRSPGCRGRRVCGDARRRTRPHPRRSRALRRPRGTRSSTPRSASSRSGR